MEGMINSIDSVLRNLNQLQESTTGENIASAETLSLQLNNYIQSLSDLQQLSNTMESSNLFPVPLDVLDSLDSENVNFENYDSILLEKCEKDAKLIADRIYFLKVSLLRNIIDICCERIMLMIYCRILKILSYQR